MGLFFCLNCDPRPSLMLRPFGETVPRLAIQLRSRSRTVHSNDRFARPESRFSLAAVALVTDSKNKERNWDSQSGHRLPEWSQHQ